MNKTRKRSKSLPIVLVPDQEQEPVALQMYGCESATPRPLLLRRSPRFFSTPTPIPIPQECSRRKSPRLTNAEPLFTGLTCEKKKTTRTKNNGENSDGSKTVVDRRVLRRSPRFSGNAKVQEMALVKVKTPASSNRKLKNQRSASYFIGDSIPNEEAQKRWGWRYEMKNQRYKGKDCASDDDDEDKIVSNVECHYAQARIGECIFDLGDCAYIKGEGTQKHIGKILEFFKTTDGEEYFRVQWFYRAEDTVMKEAADFHDRKRLFYSTVMNDNPVDCIISKVIVAQIPPKVNGRMVGIL